MDAFMELLLEYGAAGAIIAFLLWGLHRTSKKLEEHQDECGSFRKEIRDQSWVTNEKLNAIEAELKEDYAKIHSELREDTARMTGRIEKVEAIVTRIERNGNGAS